MGEEIYDDVFDDEQPVVEDEQTSNTHATNHSSDGDDDYGSDDFEALYDDEALSASAVTTNEEKPLSAQEPARKLSGEQMNDQFSKLEAELDELDDDFGDDFGDDFDEFSDDEEPFVAKSSISKDQGDHDDYADDFDSDFED